MTLKNRCRDMLKQACRLLDVILCVLKCRFQVPTIVTMQDYRKERHRRCDVIRMEIAISIIIVTMHFRAIIICYYSNSDYMIYVCFVRLMTCFTQLFMRRWSRARKRIFSLFCYLILIIWCLDKCGLCKLSIVMDV